MQGISHLTFIVSNLARMAAFLCEGLGAKEIYDSTPRNYSISCEKYFILGGLWIVAMEGEPPREKSYQHVAFKVELADLAKYKERLDKLGVEIRPSRSRLEGEGESLYVYDFDNHLFELHTGTLEERMAIYAS